MSEKILLDTDIGSDIDDAVCLAYLLANPACELMGITTVSGEPVNRAKMCSVLTHIAGQDVPIYPGVENPLIVPARQRTVPQAAQLGDWDHQEEFPIGKAISFMQEMIHAYPGEITLLPIGPLTNVGLLFSIDPEIPGLLKRLVLMGGCFWGHQYTSGAALEWNIINDPHAAEIVYRAEPPVHRSIGLDVTMDVRMDAKEVKKRFTHPLLRPVLDFADVWFERTSTIVFHDPLAATTIFDAEICQFERGTVTIELESHRLAGYCHWTADADGKCEAASKVNPQRFFDHYFSVFAD